MYWLDEALQAALAAGETIIAPNRQRAAALRLAHAWQQNAAGRAVWATPDILTWTAWLGRELGRQRFESGNGPVLLNPSQSLALWQQVLEQIEAEGLVEGDSLPAQASAIASAAATLREWHLDWPGPGPTDETVLLQAALERFDAACRAAGALQPDLAPTGLLLGLTQAPLCFIGTDRRTPRQAALPGRLLPLPQRSVPTGVASCTDAASERFAVARWARKRLDAGAGTRLLVVCADPRVDALAVRDGIVAALGTGGDDLVAVEGGSPLARQPLIATALTWLSLGTGEVDLAALSAVLLSPFHDLGGVDDCARLDAWLRDSAPRRCPADTLGRHLDRSPQALQPTAGAWSRALVDLRASFEPAPRSALEWAQRVTTSLAALGYPGRRGASSAEAQAWRRWESALEEFASLQAFIGATGPADAMAQLQALLMRSQHQAATGDAAVTVTTWRGDPVVGYDAIWVLGLTEGQWPEPPRPAPYLPLDAQRRVGLPEASAHTRLDAARQQLAAWQARAATELVLSHAQVDGDVDLEPAVLLREFPALVEFSEIPRPTIAPGAAVLDETPELLPPIVASGQQLAGGVRVPTLQRDCPFRAQAELRLGARELARPRVGVDPQLRGQLVHAALEHLWKSIGGSEALRGRPVDAWSDRIDAALDAAFARPDFARRIPPTPREFARERERCAYLLREALATEARRGAAFRITANELARTWDVAGVRLSLRIDRIDELEDGSLVVVDYKTGAVPTLELLKPAARPVQLLAYLDALEGDIAALALMRLEPGNVAFRSVEDGRAGLPRGKHAGRKAPVEWGAQREAWRADVRELVAQHLSGNAQVTPLKLACEHCPLPALCRIDSQRLAERLEAEPEAFGSDGDDE